MNNPQLIDEMRWQLKQIEDRKAENRRLLAGIAGSGHTTVVSADRSVTVLAGPGGVVSEVRLTAEAMRYDAVSLGRTITAAVREAVAAGGRLASPPERQQQQPVVRPRRQVPDEDEPYDTVYDV
ncbi:YbaB/EbfC family DNA-binding protein [Amycolatopsis sp. NBC_00348]|uniref:YbaB/EbfC family DNA-binding protein n=1 Tax=Amycolatopsis sp. NBC_00348 TaxID=2975956 RepID=UPI002E26F11E